MFDKYLTGGRWLITRVPQWLLPFWYGKEPMFWLPHGWFPYYAEWLLSFPRAPMGSVSIVSWQVACTMVVALVGDFVASLVRLALRRTPAKGPAVKIPGQPAEGKGAGAPASREKKEL